MAVLAAASVFGNAAVLFFLVVFSAGIVFGYFTIGGSAINNHPHNGRDGAPGADRPDAIHAFAVRAGDAAHARLMARRRRDEAASAHWERAPARRLLNRA
jgi:hypothetical protein